MNFAHLSKKSQQMIDNTIQRRKLKVTMYLPIEKYRRALLQKLRRVLLKEKIKRFYVFVQSQEFFK